MLLGAQLLAGATEDDRARRFFRLAAQVSGQ